MGRWIIYREHSDRRDYRWRYRADTGDIIADSAEGYDNKRDCENGIRIMRTVAPSDDIVDMSDREDY